MVGKENENGVRGGFNFHVPDNRSKWENFQRAIYDPSSNEVLGRTGKSWGQLLLFYTIFYIILAAMFAICMQVLLLSLDDKEPKWQLESSIIGTNPGLGFRPISNMTEEGSLIWYDTKNATTRQKWVAFLDEFLIKYHEDQTGPEFDACDFGKPPQAGKVCPVKLNDFDECSPEKAYGYNSSSPCVFLKLNKIFGWTPQYINDVKQLQGEGNQTVIDEFSKGTDKRDMIWVSCYGEDAIDKEHLPSKFTYHPQAGFPGHYFPYKNDKPYLSPLVAVRILNPTPNVIISIECRAWARNIQYNGGNLRREGSIRFEILIDDKGDVKDPTTAPKL